MNALIKLVEPDANSPGCEFCRDNGVEIIVLKPLILRAVTIVMPTSIADAELS